MPRASHPIALKLVVTAVALVLTAVVWSAGTWSAFNQTSASPGNSVATGTVVLGDNDAGSALLSLSNAAAGATATSCIKVTYTGTLPANVRLYGAVGGTGLASYLTLTITRGTFSGTPAAKSCTGFTADTTNYGSGAGIVYTGLLSAFPTTTAAAVLEPKAAAPEEWTTNETHGYKLTVTLGNNAAMSGKNATADFTWQAFNA